jgi:hypothetical protein
MITPNFNDKIFVSYSGGTAGDLFVSSCNGIDIGQLPNNYVTNQSSLKPYEADIIQNQISISSAVSKIKQTYISTHLNQSLINHHCEVIGIIVQDSDVQEKVIQRQMYFQTLSIAVNPGHHWFRFVRDWCLKNKHQTAAQYWFEQARLHWLNDMKIRLEQPIQKLNFDKLFTSEWTDSLINQGWKHNVDVLRKNHKIWLEKNYNFSKDLTINSIKQKLEKMDWAQTSGVIKYQPS